VGIWESRWWIGGYDLGIAFPPDWVGVFQYSAEESSERVFVPGTVVNYESDFYLPKSAGLSAIMDTIVIDEEKAELLSRIPQKLIVVEG
jgi:Xaa-Pro aminopeptidase